MKRKSTPWGVLFLYQESILQKQIERILSAYDFFNAGRTLLVACSGGMDSLVLLDLLHCLQKEGGAQIICAHYEHGIRGADSRSDADFVADFCGVREIPFVCESGDVPAYARSHKASLETAARICRYEFLHRICEARHCDAIALAHHADDLAETVLLRILRGTGPAGLAAMREWDGLHLRPLLGVARTEIEKYTEERGLCPRHDATNDALDARRNEIRHALLPELRRTYNPAVREALTRLSSLAGEEDDFLTGIADASFQRAVCPGGISVSALRDLHPALQRRVLRLFWAQETGSMQDFSYLHEERLRALLHATGTAGCDMPHHWYASSRYGVLSILRSGQVKPPAGKGEILLPFTREYAIINFRGTAFCIRRLTRMSADDWRKIRAQEAVYADLGGLPSLVLRTRRPGDYLQLPIGRKKLKDILIDDKIPREMRDAIPLVAVADTQEIFWIVGGRRSILAPLTESSTDILSITCMKETIAR